MCLPLKFAKLSRTPQVAASVNRLCQYLSFINVFFTRFSQVEMCGVTPHCLYCDSLTLSEEQFN